MSKPGSGGLSGFEASNVARRDRLRSLALEVVDIANDPYCLKNHLGSYECRLCLTLHPNEGNYLAHTQGRKHQTNLAKREKKLSQTNFPTNNNSMNNNINNNSNNFNNKNNQKITSTNFRPAIPRIGFPSYRVIKQFDSVNETFSLLFCLEFPLILGGLQPRHRFMSTFEQRRDPRDPNFQYLLFSADPYNIAAFKIPNWPIMTEPEHFMSHWDEEKKIFLLQLEFKPRKSSTTR